MVVAIMTRRLPSVRATVALVVVALLVASAGTTLAETPVAAEPPPPTATTVQQTDACQFDRVFDVSIASVVTVRVFDQSGDRGLGSGWVYAVDGSDLLVVTNAHVVDGSVGADVRFNDGQWRPTVELVGVDTYADLAVVRVENPPNGTEPLALAASPPDQGDAVAALGSPLGLEGSMTTGTVSAVDRSVTVGTEREVYTVVDAVQIDTPISPGNSGGPLLDCEGDVVGVNFAGVSPLAGQNLNFAISAATVERVVPELIENGTYAHSFVGIRGITVSPTVARTNGLDGTTQGVLVESVIAGAPADGQLHGSNATEYVTSIPIGGDVVVAVNGTEIGDVDELRDYLFENTRPGDAVAMTVLRDGSRTNVTVTVGARPPSPERASLEEPAL